MTEPQGQPQPQNTEPQQPTEQMPQPQYGQYAPPQSSVPPTQSEPEGPARTSFASRSLPLKAWQVITIPVIALLLGGAIGSGAMYAYATPVINKGNAAYAELRSEYKKADESIQLLTGQISDMQDKLSDYDDAYDNLTNLEKQADDVNAQVEAAQKKLDALNSQIDAKRGNPIQLPAGEFVVGKDVPAGRYVISGDTNFKTFDKYGDIDINTILGDGGVGRGDYHGYLLDGYYIKNYGPATLTPVEDQ